MNIVKFIKLELNHYMIAKLEGQKTLLEDEISKMEKNQSNDEVSKTVLEIKREELENVRKRLAKRLYKMEHKNE